MHKFSIQNLEFTIFIFSAKKLVVANWRNNLCEYLH